MRLKRTSAATPVNRRSGVTASVMHRNTSVHSPVERVMNSMGFAPSRSVSPKNTMRASGYHAATNTAIFAGTTQRAPAAAGRFVAVSGRRTAPSAGVCVSEAIMVSRQKFFFRSMP